MPQALNCGMISTNIAGGMDAMGGYLHYYAYNKKLSIGVKKSFQNTRLWCIILKVCACFN